MIQDKLIILYGLVCLAIAIIMWIRDENDWWE
jgi:hypothetical protein